MTKSEEPAKNWQVEVLQKQINDQGALSQRIEAKLDQIIMNQITSKQFEDRIGSLNKTYDEKLATLSKEVDLKYSPIAKSIRLVIAALFTAIIAQFIYVLFNLTRS